MPRRHVPALALAVTSSAVLAMTASAGGVFRTGAYKGKTAQHLAISFTAGKKAVRGLVFKEHGDCSDGRRSRGSQGPFTAPIKHGSFHYAGTSPSGAAHSHITGTLSGKSASGTVRLDSRFNAAGKPDPKGTLHCTTGVVQWSATRS
jgi:hypothetical protein